MEPKLAVRKAGPADAERWNQFVIDSGVANHSYLFNWSSTIERSFGQRPFYLIAESTSGNIEGILPLIHFKSRLFGSSLTSVPFINAGGIVAKSESAKQALITHVVKLHNESGTDYVELRNIESDDLYNETFSCSSHKVAYVLPLAPPLELFESFSKKLRAQIKRPQKSGYTAQFLKPGASAAKMIDDFYGIFSRNMRDLGTPVYTKRFFTILLEELKDAATIAVVSGPNGPAACGLLIGCGQRVEILLASSLRKYNADAPNMLLYWEAMQWAHLNGYKIFDFGRSTPDSGPARFKEQWGSTKKTLHWYYYPKSKTGSDVSSGDKGSFGLAVKLWRQLPVSIANTIGPFISRQIP